MALNSHNEFQQQQSYTRKWEAIISSLSPPGEWAVTRELGEGE